MASKRDSERPARPVPPPLPQPSKAKLPPPPMARSKRPPPPPPARASKARAERALPKPSKTKLPAFAPADAAVNPAPEPQVEHSSAPEHEPDGANPAAIDDGVQDSAANDDVTPPPTARVEAPPPIRIEVPPIAPVPDPAPLVLGQPRELQPGVEEQPLPPEITPAPAAVAATISVAPSESAAASRSIEQALKRSVPPAPDAPSIRTAAPVEQHSLQPLSGHGSASPARLGRGQVWSMVAGGIVIFAGGFGWWMSSQQETTRVAVEPAAVETASAASDEPSALAKPSAPEPEQSAEPAADTSPPEPAPDEQAAEQTEEPAARAEVEEAPEPPELAATSAEPDEPSKDEPSEDKADALDEGSAEDFEPDGSIRGAASCEQLLGKSSAGGDSETLIDEAEKLVRYGKTEQAHRAYCLAVKLSPDSARAALGLAQLLLLQRDAEAAASWARKALKLSADSESVKNTLADALVRFAGSAEARTLWLEAAGLESPTPEQLAQYLAITQAHASKAFGRKDYRRAEIMYRRVVAFEPQNRTALSRLGATLKRLGEPEASLIWAKRALAAPVR